MTPDILTEVPKISVKLDDDTHFWAKTKASMQHLSLMEYVRLLIEHDIEAISLRDLQKKYKDATKRT